jgi:hypothetical protein
VIRARIYRDGPGCWAFAVVDADGIHFTIGNADTWDEARDAALGELRIFDAPPPEPPLISPAARERSWLARVLCPPSVAA